MSAVNIVNASYLRYPISMCLSTKCHRLLGNPNLGPIRPSFTRTPPQEIQRNSCNLKETSSEIILEAHESEKETNGIAIKAPEIEISPQNSSPGSATGGVPPQMSAPARGNLSDSGNLMINGGMVLLLQAQIQPSASCIHFYLKSSTALQLCSSILLQQTSFIRSEVRNDIHFPQRKPIFNPRYGYFPEQKWRLKCMREYVYRTKCIC